MSHPLYFPGTTYLYALGNTSAVRLTEHLPPEQPANILLLACGDPRHILYTVYTSDAIVDVELQKVDITCCDVEAAVLARNALLFTLLAEEGSQHRLDLIWNIFYHFKLDQESLSLLIEQSRKLQTLSKDLESWKAGPYSHFLTVCDKRTLEELHRFWSLYVETTEYAPDRRKSFNKGFMDGMKEVGKRYADGHVLTSSRSAGPLLVYATKTVAEQFRQFWTSGITDDGLHNTEHASFVNPTFAFSAAGDKFAIHYGLDPVAGFHLAEVFATSQNATPAILVQKVVEAARSQFSQWCTSVIGLLKASPSKLVIRMFAGDALMLCQALSHLNSSGDTTTPIQSLPWVASRIKFDENQYGEGASNPAPTTFNVIDTSNVSDHVGLLNLLVVTSSILSKSPSATLYTETLLSYGEESASVVLERLCGDIQTMSFLLGVIPSSFLSRFTTRSNVHEMMLKVVIPTGLQYYERVSWKAVDSKYPLAFEPDQLGQLLSQVYLKMFSDENMIRHRVQNMRVSSSQAIPETTLVHYTRRSFVELLRHIKSRFKTDWGRVMTNLDDAIMDDETLMLGTNFCQEMYCHLHLLDLVAFPSMEPSYIHDLQTRTQSVIFRDWESIPTAVTVVLVIPPSKVTHIESELRRAGTPVLLCEIRNSHLWNIFAHISAAYGRFEATGSDQTKTATIVPPKEGEKGSSSLIIFFSVLSSSLMLSGDATVGLRTRPSPRSTLRDALFTAPLESSRHVHVLAEPPSPLNTCLVASKLPAQVVRDNKHTFTARTNVAGTEISSFVVRAEVTDPVGQASLKAGSAVEIEEAQGGGARLCVDNYVESISFPLPVNIANTKLHADPESKCIKVIAPLAQSMNVQDEQKIPKRFQTVLDGGLPASYVHRVNLDRCPPFNPLANSETPTWLVPHATLMFSDRELGLRRKASPIADDTCTGTGAVYLCIAEHGNTRDARLHLIADLRLDVSSYTILADSWIVPGTLTVQDELSELEVRSVVAIRIDTHEAEAWRHLLPLFVERCRTWTHRADCEFVANGSMPLYPDAGANPEKSPWCACGVGHGTETFPGDFKSLAPYATRAAISPLFAVPYLEKVGGKLGELADSKTVTQGEEASQEERCKACGKQRAKQPLRFCGKCKSVRYCSRECQTKDWKVHKKTCT